MKYSYSMAGKQYGTTTTLVVSATLVMATVMLCLAAMRVPSSFVFLTTVEPYNGRLFPQQQVAGLENYQYSTDERLHLDAVEASRIPPPAAAAPKIAFLFMVRGDIPFEPLWSRYFAGHEGRYSLYVHAKPNFTYSSSSLFFGKQIPSQVVERLKVSLADAILRLYAMALLDWASNNAWFVLVDETTIPVRSFNFTYDYLMGSHHSFVQAFQPTRHYTDAFTYYAAKDLRKGEIWMALNRKHTITLLADDEVYKIFLENCREFCYFDESYFQTFFNLKDPGGIANRTLMFVDWSGEHVTSPRSFHRGTTNAALLHRIASLTEDSMYGQHHDTAFQQNMTVRCEYNGVPGAACFLFARKFIPNALNGALEWHSHIEEFETQISSNLDTAH